MINQIVSCFHTFYNNKKRKGAGNFRSFIPHYTAQAYEENKKLIVRLRWLPEKKNAIEAAFSYMDFEQINVHCADTSFAQRKLPLGKRRGYLCEPDNRGNSRY